MTNGTMMQYFHWYFPVEDNLWDTIAENAPGLAEMGINALWMPPAYKGKEGAASVGYDTYDLYDLGEFDQKGAVRTRYGNRAAYEKAIAACHQSGIQVYADIVLNHKAGADGTEKMTVRRVNPDNRTEFISEPFGIEAYTKFTFPGRNNQYSDFTWDYTCFSGVDYASDINESGIFCILNEYGDGWEEMIDDELGNYDYLMFADIEFRNPAVCEELNKWGEWYLKTFTIDGVRLDAVKHISPRFYNEWLDFQRQHNPNLVAIGEYWAPGDLPLLIRYIEVTEGRMSLFDAALHHNFHNASQGGNEYNLSTILDNSLVQVKPELAVTVVDNHDTQPLQALEAPVEAWFKPLAYALILLREGGYPCVFYPDVYGAHYVDKGRDGNDHEIFLEQCKHIDLLLQARQSYAYGIQRDYFDHPNCIGWTREGNEEGSGCAVVLSNGEAGNKKMEIGKQHAGKVFVDYVKEREEEVTIDEEGWAGFFSPAGGISVWVEKKG